MKKVDILYICPPSGKQKEFELSIGIAYLQAYLNNFGYTSKQLIPKTTNFNNIIQEIVNINPKIIGFSVYDMNYYYVKIIAKKIKKILNIPIVLGGPTATFSSSKIFNDLNSNIDYTIRGYGEIPTKMLLDFIINKNGTLNDIPSISYKKNNKIINNAIIEIPTNIDIFPSPYLSNINFFPSRKIVFSSRGCYHNCVYCNCASMCKKKIYYHSITRVISELQYIADKEPGSYVLIGDDAFTLNINRAKDICREIIKKNINLKLFCETRADRIDYELLLLLKQSGFIKIDFGLESASPKILRNVKKVFYNDSDINYLSEKKFIDNMKKIIMCTKKLKLDPMVNIITGLPGETIEDANITLNFIKKLNINSYSHNYLKIYSGTEIFNEYKKWKYKLVKNEFVFPTIVKYPFDVKKVTPLNNSVSRSEIVRLKKSFIEIWKNKKYYTLQDLYSTNFNNIEINKEIFIKVNNKKEETLSLKFIVTNDIPTSNIVFIRKSNSEIRCFNHNDRENYIIIKILKNSNFVIPNNYYTLLYVEYLTSSISKKFKLLNINPYLNRFVIIENDIKKRESIDDIIFDYCITYNQIGNEELLIRFVKYISYDFESLNIELFKNILNKEIFSVCEIIIIKKFLNYYMLGVVENE